MIPKPLSKRQTFGPVQIENTCKRQIKYGLHVDFCVLGTRTFLFSDNLFQMLIGRYDQTFISVVRDICEGPNKIDFYLRLGNVYYISYYIK